jgi:chitinase
MTRARLTPPRASTRTLPSWSVTTEYQNGGEVLYQGLPYQARGANQGTQPSTAETDPAGSPWKPLYTIPGEPTGLTGVPPGAGRPLGHRCITSALWRRDRGG